MEQLKEWQTDSWGSQSVSQQRSPAAESTTRLYTQYAYPSPYVFYRAHSDDKQRLNYLQVSAAETTELCCDVIIWTRYEF